MARSLGASLTARRGDDDRAGPCPAGRARAGEGKAGRPSGAGARAGVGEYSMTIQTRPLTPAFGVEILGVNLRHVDDATFAEISRAFNDHSVLLFRAQGLDDEEQIAFS